MSDEFNHIPEAMAAIHEAARKAVVKATMDVVAHASETAPVGKTGFLHNSIYSVTSEGSDYRGGEKALPEVAKPDDELRGIAAVAANYGEYVERGTRFMEARPYLMPAADKVRGSLGQVFAKLIEAELKAKIGGF